MASMVLWLPLDGESQLAPQKHLVPFRSPLLLFISDSEHLRLLSSPCEHHCPVHPKIARLSHPIIPSPGHSEQGWQGLWALLPVPFSPAVRTPLTPVSASPGFMSRLLLQRPQILADRSLWSCQHRQDPAGPGPLRSNCRHQIYHPAWPLERHPDLQSRTEVSMCGFLINLFIAFLYLFIYVWMFFCERPRC